MASNGNVETSPWVDDPIAIIGMGLRLPGSISNPEKYWELLTSKGSGRGRVHANRYNVDAFIGPKGKAGHTCTEFGYFLEDIDLATIDSSFWSMSRKEVGLMDPQQRLMLEVAYEYLESSDIQAKDSHNSGMYRITGYGDFTIANRVSYELGFTGPSLTIRTTCSSSLTALYEACQGIYAGECSSAVVGGCNLILSPHMTVAMAEQGVISPTGYCRSFDANADGYARGEAINAIHIKRLSAAIRDGDNIRAIIRSACINSDGKTAGLSFPSPESHEKIIRRSHTVAGITDLSKTAMIECHGTGTTVGDPLEARAVAQVFVEWGILIGSVKTNLGHSEGASGLSSVIKMVLALENQTIPPNINFTTPNPKIPFDSAHLRVPVECEPWPTNKHELVGVNCFGIGGANAHVLLQSARSIISIDRSSSSGTNQETQNTHLLYICTNPANISDYGHTLACRRERFPYRAFAIGSLEHWDVSQIQRATSSPDLIWLIGRNPIAKRTIDRLDYVLDEIDPSRTWTLHDELSRAGDLSNLGQAEYSQPCCTAIQIVLVDVLRSLNIHPSAVVGHSSGEIGAAYAVNTLSAADAISVAYHRGKVSRRAEETGKGGMMVVGLGRERISPFLADGAIIACENSPANVTVGGEPTVLDSVASAIQAAHPDVLVRRLRVNCAYHSAQMEEVESEYRELLATLQFPRRTLSGSFVSSVTGKVVQDAAELGPNYWCRNLTSPVLFYSAVASVLGQGTIDQKPNPVFLELREIALATHKKSVPYITTLVRKANAYSSILHTAGRLFQLDASIDPSGLCPGNLLSDLPPYPWHHDGHFWSESPVTRNWRLHPHPHHDILGSQITDGNDKQPTWRSGIHLGNVPWIRDHNILGETVFPGAGYVAMAGEAIRQLTGRLDFTVRKTNIITALVMHEDRPTEVLTQFRPSRVTVTLDSDWYDFTIMSLLDGVWTKNCTGQARGGRDFAINIPCPVPGPRIVEPPVWYRAMEKFGFDYGPRFQGMQQITASVTAPAATAEVIDTREPGESSYSMHPCAIDCIFQLFNLYVRPPSGPIATHAAVEPTPKGAFYGDAAGFCGQELVFSVRKMRLSLLSDGEDVRGVDPHAAARLVWQPDIEEVDISRLIRPGADISEQHFLHEELALSCIVETEYQARDITPSLPHYAKFKAWLQTQLQRAKQGVYDHVPSCRLITSMASAERKSHMDSLYHRALETDARHVATAIRRICSQGTALFLGDVDSLSLLLEDDLIAAIYNFIQLCDFADFFRVFAHNRPRMRVLEIGAGTGGFFNAAQTRFKEYEAMIYRPLDITIDPLAQGFDSGSYDLIIASNAVHVTASLQESLGNVRKLLKPDGKLFLQELAPITKWINYIMCTLPGWWLGEPDGRPWEPYISPARWDAELRQAGLSGSDACIHDNHINMHIISSAMAESSQAAEAFVTLLNARGIAVDIRRLGQERPTEQMVISLLELDKPLVHSLGAEEFLNLRDLINSLGTTPLLWLTRPSQVACSDPRYAPILGLLRTARTELLVTAATLELDSLNERALGTAVTVAERLMKGTSLDPSLDPVLEYAYSRGQLMVTLQIGKRGLLQTLSWKPKPASTASPPDDWVEVQTRAVGLNFKDLLIAMGVVDGGDLGAECAGVVRRVGPTVKDLRVGDRVAVFAAGSFSTRLITGERLCARMARELGWVEAATMPCVFATVLYSLVDVARLKTGDTVLVHSACGGIGLAAIQVCRMVGAEIYCTVGSDRKVKYLVDIGIPQDRIFRSRDNTFLHDVLAATGGRGVDVVLNSLSGELLHASWQCVAEFRTMVELGKRDFIGKGHLAMEAFESNRTFTGVDLGLICERRPDIIRGLLRRCMHHFALGELSPLPVQEFAAEHVEQAFRYMQKGTHVGKIAVIMPDEPSTLPLSLNPRTPQFCPDACHLIIGGLGGLGRSVSSWMSLHGARHFVFFSRSAADREQDDFVLELRAQGCRVDLVSGDVSNEEDVDGLIERLQHPLAGIMQASMVLRDVSLATMSYKDWQAAYVPKVQGTWNLHRSLEKSRCSVDYFVLFSSWSGLVGQSGQANYAAGNAFLDAFAQYRHSLGRPCSAINIGVVEDVGYVSRNPHLLDHFRATSVHTLQEQNLLDRVQLAIDNSLPAPDQHASAAGPLGLSSYTSHSQICIGLRTTIPLESQGNRTLWRRDPRMALYHNMGASGAKPTNTANEDDQALDHFLQQAKLTPAILSEQASADLLAEETGKALFNFMLRDHSELDYNVPLANLGVDSLLAIELRNWFRLKMTLDVTVLEILGSGSLRRLGDLAAKNMASKMDAAEASSSDKTATLRDIETRYLNMKAP
ncbi:hypothetical protein BDW71DRAFT_195088 [Aspergillus fruticulosus]